MLNLISSVMLFFSSQTENEKRLTILGLALFAGLIFYLILDSTIKQKWIPKNGTLRSFLIFVFILTIIAGGVYIIFVK